MKITRATRASDFAEHMGPDATKTEAEDMMALCRALGFDDTVKIPENVWQIMLKNICGPFPPEDGSTVFFTGPEE